VSQLRGIHVDRCQRRDRQKYARRRQPALYAPSFAKVGRSLRPANKTVINVSVQIESLPAALRFVRNARHTIDKEYKEASKTSQGSYQGTPSGVPVTATLVKRLQALAFYCDFARP